jgi:hypothetical protein
VATPGRGLRIEARLGDPAMVLSSFIVSNTHRGNVKWWKDGSATEQDFANNHVLFQKDDKHTYIEALLAAVYARQ